MINEKVQGGLKYATNRFIKDAKGVDEKKIALAKDLLKGINANNFKMEDLEIMNHFNGRVDDEVFVKEYISENPAPYWKALIIGDTGKVTGMIGDTGVGKFHELLEFLRKNPGYKLILVVPFSGLARQMMCDSKGLIKGSYGRGGSSVASLIKEGCRAIVCTWDKLSVAIKNNVDMSDYVLIRDECHALMSTIYRHEVIIPIDFSVANSITNRFKGVVDITATPTRLDTSDYSYICRYHKICKTAKKHFIYRKKSKNTIKTIIENAKGITIVIQDNIEQLKKYEEEFKDKKNVSVLYSEIKDTSDLYETITTKGSLGGYTLILTTDMLNAGISIYDLDVTDIIIVDMKDPSKITQADSRCRKVKELNVHIFNDYAKNQRNFRYVKNDIAKLIDKSQRMADEFNKDNLDDNKLFGDVFSINSSGLPLLLDDSGKFYVDKVSIRTKAYDNYYATRDLAQFRVLLSEYATDITVIENEEDSQQKEKSIPTRAVTKEGEAYIDRFKYHKPELVGCCSVMKSEILSEDLTSFFNRNNKNSKELNNVYKVLGIDIENKDFVKHNREYTELVVEHNCDYDFAWNYAKATTTEKKKFNLMIAFLKFINKKDALSEKDFEKLKKVNPTIQRFSYLLDNFNVGTRYTTDVHLELLLKDMNKLTDFETIGIKELKFIINTIIKSNRRNLKVDLERFYKNKPPKKVDKKNISKCYEVTSFITEQDIANLLDLDINNKTLQRLLNS